MSCEFLLTENLGHNIPNYVSFESIVL